VVVDTVPLIGTLEAGKPTIAVRSSVADETRLEEVMVALLAPEIMVAGNVLGKEAALGVAGLLGIEEADSTEESCAERHCVSRIHGRRLDSIGGIIWTVVEI
jgi:hypothetical protein